MFLGVKSVLAKSFARIHRANLVNFGILPLVFADPLDYDRLTQGDRLVIKNLPKQLEQDTVIVTNLTAGWQFEVKHQLSRRLIEVVKAGGLLNYNRNH